MLGQTRVRLDPEDPANEKACMRMCEPHDALKRGGLSGHDLERLLVRILFCLFNSMRGALILMRRALILSNWQRQPRCAKLPDNMRLDKWYLDAVFPDGTVWFGCRARLRLWKCPAIPWAFGCEFLPNGRERKVSRLGWKELTEPGLENGQWVWKGPDGFHARWEPSGPGADCVLASDEHLRVRWNCLAPKATVTRILGDGTEKAAGGSAVSSGIGYVEHLQIQTDRPCLPFRQLGWGRAHAGESSLVWIRWGRGRELSLLLENGARVNGRLETFSKGGARVRTEHGEWETGSGRPLCDRDTRRSFPRWLVRLAGGMAPEREIKMAGPARLRTASGDFTGSGVWEEVRWA
jgi:hypothetical protein